jgi:hypothetical protein
MRKQIYNFICDLLESMEDGQVQHIDIWNSQMEFIQGEQAFLTPAVFIEFQPVEWHLQGGRIYEAEVRINLHVITDSRAGNVIEVFDLLNAINKQLHCKHAENIDAVTHLSSTTDNRFSELMHNIETYSFHGRDLSAVPLMQTAKPTIKINIDI